MAALPDHNVLLKFPSELPKEALEISAVINVAPKKESKFFDRLGPRHRHVSSPHLKKPETIADIGPEFAILSLFSAGDSSDRWAVIRPRLQPSKSATRFCRGSAEEFSTPMGPAATL